MSIPKVKPSKCELLGHDWMSTTADNFRQCQRVGCKWVERLGLSGWVKVEVGSKRKKVVQVTQSALFHVEAAQSGQLTPVAKDWTSASLEAPKTFGEVQRTVVEKMDHYVQERGKKLG